MRAHIRKSGNGAVVRLPAPVLAAAGIAVDDPVEVRAERGRLVIERAGTQAVTLESLLEGITSENLHGETDRGPPVGREVW